MVFFVPVNFSVDLFFPSFYYDYYLIVLFLVFVFLFIGIFIFFLVYTFNNRYWNISQTQSIYECGFLPFEEARVRFEPKFYMIALSFIIFDLEVCFIFPWLLVFNLMNLFYFFIFLFFFLLVLFGLVYEWKNNIFDWNSPTLPN